MAWKVLASPLAQVCIYFIVSIFLLYFFFQFGCLLNDVFVAFVVRQKRQKCFTLSIVMFIVAIAKKRTTSYKRLG